MAGDKRSARMGLLAVVALVLLGLLGTRMWFLQTVQAAPLQARVDAARQKTVFIAPERGRIFDADGRVLADNRRILTVTVDRQQIRRESVRAELFDRLSGPLGVPVDEMQRRYESVLYSTFLPLPLREDVDEPTVLYLLQRSEDFPGVDVQEDYVREYPYAPLAAHVVGYMGPITKEDVQDYLGLGYQRNERVGRFGVEMSMETVLHGAWGYVTYEVDSANRPLRVIDQVDPTPGQDVQLTIDLDIQQYAEQALQTKLRMQRSVTITNPTDLKTGELIFENFPESVPYKAPAGSVIVMDHANGHIVAMASYPTFDNRWMNASISGDKYRQLFPETDDPDRSILVNRAIQGRYNLGSTFKPFVAYAALHSGLITANDVYEDEGTYKMESVSDEARAAGVRFEYKNATCGGTGRPCVYGNVTVEDALAVSSDAFFYRIGEQMMLTWPTLEALQDELRGFGFGSDTGIDLPYEFDGVVPNKETKARYAADGIIKPDEGRNYYTGDNVQLAIGQGLLSSTPLHLTTAYAALANGGTVLVPEVVAAIYAPGTPDGDAGYAALESGTVVKSFAEPTVARQLSMPDNISGPIIEGLTRVITGPGTDGHKTTGQWLFFPPSWFFGLVPNYPYGELPLAGKTGTAQGAASAPWNDSSAFAAFSLDPEQPYTTVAYLEKAGYGSESAAPVVKCIFMALAGANALDPVEPSLPLDPTSTAVAEPVTLADPLCLNAATNNTIRE